MSGGEARDQSKDEAWQQSRGCPYCEGHGFARVYLPQYRGNPSEECDVIERGEVVRRPIPVAVSAHCVCPIGRWMRGRTDRDLLARIPDLADVLAGRSRWLGQDPTRDERGEYRPIEPGRARRELGERMRVR